MNRDTETNTCRNTRIAYFLLLKYIYLFFIYAFMYLHFFVVHISLRTVIKQLIHTYRDQISGTKQYQKKEIPSPLQADTHTNGLTLSHCYSS